MGAQKTAFDQLVSEFNETVGMERGIYVEAASQGGVSQLIENVIAASERKVGTQPIPNIFAAYADTAHQVDQLGPLADLDPYFTREELDAYVPAYIEEGRLDGVSLKILPTAKSTEILMINSVDWQKFAQAAGASLDSLSTIEGLVQTAGAYYDWTDGLTPNIAGDGRAFFGRDAMANYLIIGSRQLGAEIFSVEDGLCTFQTDPAVLRKLWDCYYVPYINGCFSAYGRFRSDDAKIGEIIALVGSSSSAVYFPDEVTVKDTASYPIEAIVLPAPCFAGGKHVAVQQGAGMSVTRSTPQEEYASLVFLKWFTEPERNIRFCAASGYLPVMNKACDVQTFEAGLDGLETPLPSKVRESLMVALETVNSHELYTNQAFKGGTGARNILESSLSGQASQDLAAIEELTASGVPREEAVARFNTDENFNTWREALIQSLQETVQ